LTDRRTVLNLSSKMQRQVLYRATVICILKWELFVMKSIDPRHIEEEANWPKNWGHCQSI